MFTPNTTQSPTSNAGYQRVFKSGKLTLGIFPPIEAFNGDMPTMQNQVALAQFAERAGFASPAFRDVPLRHPIHTAKAAASIDQLSQGRLLLGVASGDRPIEFPAFGVDFETLCQAFREKLELLKIYWSHYFPQVYSSFGYTTDADVIPKPVLSHVPLLVTGHSHQDLSWIAEHADGWMSYPRSIDAQEQVVKRWRDAVETVSPGQYKPFTRSYFIDLVDAPNVAATPIHLGHRLGRNALSKHLRASKRIGVDHLIFNLKYGKRPAEEVLQELAEFVLPEFV